MTRHRVTRRIVVSLISLLGLAAVTASAEEQYSFEPNKEGWSTYGAVTNVAQSAAWFEAALLSEAGWQGAQWIGSSQDYKAPEPAPAEWMGSWISSADDNLPFSRLPAGPLRPALAGDAASGGNHSSQLKLIL